MNHAEGREVRGGFMEFKIINDFLPKDELEKLDNRDFSNDIREAKTKERIVVSNGDWNETVKAEKTKMTANENVSVDEQRCRVTL